MIFDDSITNALGLRSLKDVFENNPVDGEIVSSIEQPPLPSTVNSDEVVADIETAKQNIADLLVSAKTSFDSLSEVAKSSQNARDFEVVATLMKTLLEANKDFVSMSEKKKYAKEDSSSSAATTNITNNNLILSTTDLLKMIKEKHNE